MPTVARSHAILFAALATTLPATATAAGPTARIDTAGQSASIGNEHVRLTIDWTEGVRLSHFADVAAGIDWIPQPPRAPPGPGPEGMREGLIWKEDDIWPDLAPASREFLLGYSPGSDLGAAKEAAAKAIRLTGAAPCSFLAGESRATVEENRARLDIVFAIDGHPIAVGLHAEVCAGVNAVRRWTSVRNTNAAPWLLHRLHLRPERLDAEIARCRDLGVELFILDYDWFPLLGDFRSDPARFPDGVEAISRKVKAAGMKFGLWMGFGQAYADAAVVREHPEFLVTRNGEPVTGGWGMRSLCFASQPCREYVLGEISRVVERFGVDWLKQDFEIIPVSDSRVHAPHATDTRIESVEGYYWVKDRLRERFPKLYLDNWTPPMGGADFGNLQRHHSMLLCDDYHPTAVRSAAHGVAHLFAPTRTHGYLRAFSRGEETSPTPGGRPASATASSSSATSCSGTTRRSPPRGGRSRPSRPTVISSSTATLTLREGPLTIDAARRYGRVVSGGANATCCSAA